MEQCEQLQLAFEQVRNESEKFFLNGNKAAGTRARKGLQELKRLAQVLRILIQDTRKEREQAAREGGALADEPGADAKYESELDQQHLQHHQPQSAGLVHDQRYVPDCKNESLAMFQPDPGAFDVHEADGLPGVKQEFAVQDTTF